jgi:dTDP-4-dehydrorhamnose reductase
MVSTDKEIPREFEMQSSESKKILIVGIDSEIGSAFAQYISEKGSYQVVGTTRRKLKSRETESLYQLDLANLESNLPRLDYYAIVICAGVTNQVICKEEPELTWRVNVDNTIEVIKRFYSLNTQVIFLSSCSVFDGTKPFSRHTDAPNPISNYGKQKVAVEEFLQKNLANYAILRLTKVISEETRFIKNWRKSAAKGESIRAYSNRLLSPVGVMEVCKAVESIIGTRSSGLFQLGGRMEHSYFEFAQSYFQDEPSHRNLIVSVEDPHAIGGVSNSLASNLPIETLDSPLT